MMCGNHPMDTHRTDQMLENAEFLEGTGMHIELVASRLDVTVEQLVKARERRRRAESNTDEVAGVGA